MNSKKQDFSWIKEGIEKIKKYDTLKSEKGQELYNRAWLKHNMMPQTVAEWERLFEEIHEFMIDPTNPQEDKEKISDIMEGAALMRNTCKAIEEEKKGKNNV